MYRPPIPSSPASSPKKQRVANKSRFIFITDLSERMMGSVLKRRICDVQKAAHFEIRSINPPHRFPPGNQFFQHDPAPAKLLFKVGDPPGGGVGGWVPAGPPRNLKRSLAPAPRLYSVLVASVVGLSVAINRPFQFPPDAVLASRWCAVPGRPVSYGVKLGAPHGAPGCSAAAAAAVGVAVAVGPGSASSSFGAPRMVATGGWGRMLVEFSLI